MERVAARGQPGARHGLGLVTGVLLAVVPRLPGLEGGLAYERFSNWATFAGGLLIGAVLADARLRFRGGGRRAE